MPVASDMAVWALHVEPTIFESIMASSGSAPEGRQICPLLTYWHIEYPVSMLACWDDGSDVTLRLQVRRG